jgi:hypothetical protein
LSVIFALQVPHDFPGRLAEEHLGRDDVGISNDGECVVEGLVVARGSTIGGGVVAIHHGRITTKGLKVC